MPALITHHLFGEEAATQLPQGVLDGQESLLAFLLGNQGPDPLFFRFSTLPTTAAAVRRLGSAMHRANPYPTFAALRQAVGRLRPEDAAIGRAFALGFLAHYLLDSTAHPFVYAQQNALIAAGDGLEGAASEVHAIIEADLDSWMLWSLRHITVEDAPSSSNLCRTSRIDRVAGALVSQVAMQAFATRVNADEFAGCTADYEFVMRAIDPAGSKGAEVISSLERLVRPQSMLGSLTHRVTTSDECPAANLEHAPWTDPSTGAVRSESFADLFYSALGRWDGLAHAFIAGKADVLATELGGVDFNGAPVASPDAGAAPASAAPGGRPSGQE